MLGDCTQPLNSELSLMVPFISSKCSDFHQRSKIRVQPCPKKFRLPFEKFNSRTHSFVCHEQILNYITLLYQHKQITFALLSYSIHSLFHLHNKFSNLPRQQISTIQVSQNKSKVIRTFSHSQRQSRPFDRLVPINSHEKSKYCTTASWKYVTT